jgi:hypothetical protein
VSPEEREKLMAAGHNFDGLCEKCWAEARLRYYGSAQYESHVDAYNAVLDDVHAALYPTGDEQR